MCDRWRVLWHKVRAGISDWLFSLANLISCGKWRSPEVTTLRQENHVLRKESARWQFRAERLDALMRHWQKEARLAKAGLAIERTPVHVDVRIQ